MLFQNVDMIDNAALHLYFTFVSTMFPYLQHFAFVSGVAGSQPSEDLCQAFEWLADWWLLCPTCVTRSRSSRCMKLQQLKVVHGPYLQRDSHLSQIFRGRGEMTTMSIRKVGLPHFLCFVTFSMVCGFRLAVCGSGVPSIRVLWKI
jgi:hypothetical protein